jgi:hypothetical protein
MPCVVSDHKYELCELRHLYDGGRGEERETERERDREIDREREREKERDSII